MANKRVRCALTGENPGARLPVSGRFADADVPHLLGVPEIRVHRNARIIQVRDLTLYRHSLVERAPAGRGRGKTMKSGFIMNFTAGRSRPRRRRSRRRWDKSRRRTAGD